MHIPLYWGTHSGFRVRIPLIPEVGLWIEVIFVFVSLTYSVFRSRGGGPCSSHLSRQDTRVRQIQIVLAVLALSRSIPIYFCMP